MPTAIIIAMPTELHCGTCGHVLAQEGEYAYGDTTAVYECRNTTCPQYFIDMQIPYQTYTATVQP
jgi:hypothetical protein